jgi:hypothetical protein
LALYSHFVGDIAEAVAERSALLLLLLPLLLLPLLLPPLLLLLQFTSVTMSRAHRHNIRWPHCRCNSRWWWRLAAGGGCFGAG